MPAKHQKNTTIRKHDVHNICIEILLFISIIIAQTRKLDNIWGKMIIWSTRECFKKDFGKKKHFFHKFQKWDFCYALFILLEI